MTGGSGRSHATSSPIPAEPRALVKGFQLSAGQPVPSSLLADRYELRAPIGSGTMATVWDGFDRRLQREVAVKVLAASLAMDVRSRRRFKREARHVASLSHPNIVAVHDFGTDGDQLFIVMELIRGHSLRIQLTGPQPPEQVLSVAGQILAGLGHAHGAGIIHRDIKPANILLTEAGVPKLVDFGIAKAGYETSALTQHGAVLASFAYASPEQVAGEDLGPASDLYSLGCVLYECLTGRPPFLGDNLAALALQHRREVPVPLGDLVDGAPPALIEVIMRSLAKDPTLRFATAREMAEALPGGEALPSLPLPVAIRGPVVGGDTHYELRSGTITFLFTDIEGSTVLWEAHRAEMAPAMARHNEILGDAIESASGHVFKTVGGGFCAAFSAPGDAVTAAVNAQHALKVVDWPEGATLRVRMGLHTLVGDEQKGDYFGPTLTRTARLMGIAHGGQTLLSHATAELVEDWLTDGTFLVDLGEHRLNDLTRPEQSSSWPP